MELDFLSMSTVMLRVRLSAPMVVALMVLHKAGEDMEVFEVVKLGGISATVAYRTLSYLESKGWCGILSGRIFTAGAFRSGG